MKQCDVCHDDGYVMVEGEMVPCPCGCEVRPALMTDMRDASQEEDYER